MSATPNKLQRRFLTVALLSALASPAYAGVNCLQLNDGSVPPPIVPVPDSTAPGAEALACGPDAKAIGNGATAIGDETTATGNNSTAIGSWIDLNVELVAGAGMLVCRQRCCFQGHQQCGDRQRCHDVRQRHRRYRND